MPNDFFGINCLFGQNIRREYARTLRSRAELIILDNKDLLRLMEVNFEFSEKWMAMYVKRILQLEERALALTERPAKERFARFLTDLIQRAGRHDGKDWFYNSQLTQEEIGAYIGTGRQTITEILTDMKSKNILTYSWGKFWVHNLNGLQA